MRFLRKMEKVTRSGSKRLVVPRFWGQKFNTDYCSIEIHDTCLIVRPFFLQDGEEDEIKCTEKVLKNEL